MLHTLTCYTQVNGRAGFVFPITFVNSLYIIPTRVRCRRSQNHKLIVQCYCSETKRETHKTLVRMVNKTVHL